MQRRELPADWDRNLPVFSADPKGVAGRDASGRGAQRARAEHPVVPRGSADLGPSNRTTLTYDGAGDFQAEKPGGKNLHFGIREHAMAATVGSSGRVIACRRSGLPRPLKELQTKFGFQLDRVVAAAREQLGR